MIGVLVGHTLAEPGAVCPGMEPERTYNRRLADAVQERFDSIKFEGAVIIDAPDAPPPGKGISERISAAKAAKVSHIIELHHNCNKGQASRDYAEILYYRPSWRGRAMAEFFEQSLYPRVLLKNGIERIRSTPLPNPAYGHKAIVERTPWPAIILEVAFLDNQEHKLYFKPEAQRRFGFELADIIIAWANQGRR